MKMEFTKRLRRSLKKLEKRICMHHRLVKHMRKKPKETGAC